MSFIQDIVTKLSGMYISRDKKIGKKLISAADSLDSMLVSGEESKSSISGSSLKIKNESYVREEKNTKNLAVDYLKDLLVLGYDTIKTKVKRDYSSIKSKVEQIYVVSLGSNAVKTAKEIFLRFCLFVPPKNDQRSEELLKIYAT